MRNFAFIRDLNLRRFARTQGHFKAEKVIRYSEVPLLAIHGERADRGGAVSCLDTRNSAVSLAGFVRVALRKHVNVCRLRAPFESGRDAALLCQG